MMAYKVCSFYKVKINSNDQNGKSTSGVCYTSRIISNAYVGRFFSYWKEMLKTGILFIYLKPQRHASNNDAIYKWLINKKSLWYASF
ncbi:hypothetical protein V1477_001180 [Vespula maculifrons]|uniref:Uncharacterized protein n=1 Tax=Vespula maculifrons TaxID=7453 RepID=A0ABD2D187_VESMC